MIITRFAPSPTGDLHLGGALVALESFWRARTRDGRIVLRVEDIDTPRVVKESEARIEEDLAWLGFSFDERVRQSERTAAYEAALARLSPWTYPCDCSRKEIASIASAPHEGEEIAYPGTCRDRDPARKMKRSPAIRLRLPARIVSFDDDFAGPISTELSQSGDIVLRRGDGVFAYQLVVVVDDLASHVTEVVRGDDLLSSTARQIYVFECLGASPPRYAHVPIVRDRDGVRLAKRTRGASVRELREGGVSKERVLGELAFALGLIASAHAVTLEELLAQRERIAKLHALTIPEDFLHLPSARGR